MELSVQDPWFTFIVNGVKTVEGRKNSQKYYKGQILKLTNGKDWVMVQVSDIRSYPDILSYLEKEEFWKVLPGVQSLQEALSIYRSFQSKDPTEADRIIQNAGGILALELKIV